MNLADELLPPLPQGTISLPTSINVFAKGSTIKKSSASSSAKQDSCSAPTIEISAREKLLRDQPELLQQFGVDLLPLLIKACDLGDSVIILYFPDVHFFWSYIHSCFPFV